ncbi:TetR/AcrR family transcriptional regulator [Nonomuraea sp. NPDC050783]|uniref:TetR/AcrR family transcriptional regulator n=1 Tax=Nonomuraea sp. NPDC050783 TaxID=3154634 RepID=UPI0034652998
MPIYVDHDARRKQIMDAAVRVLGDEGLDQFTLRKVGRRLGGSVTLVTHYFPSRGALMKAMLERTLEDAHAMRDELTAIEDQHDRLEAVLRGFLPDNEEALAQERARVALVSHRNVDPDVDEFFARIEPSMRDVIRSGIEGFVDPDELDAMVDLVRVWASGMVLSVIEHPEMWTPERQRQALRHFVRVLELPERQRTA